MLTLDSSLRIPEYVLSTTVEEEVILLNTQTNKYFTLDDVGARLWNLLSGGKSLRECHLALLQEYDVEPDILEQDLLELVDTLRAGDLVEITPI